MVKKNSLFVVALVVFIWVFMPLVGIAQSPCICCSQFGTNERHLRLLQ